MAKVAKPKTAGDEMRIEVKEKFNWRNPAITGRTVSFKPGTYTVKRVCGEAAVAAGKAVEITTVMRNEAASSK